LWRGAAGGFNVITNPLLHRAEAESSKDFIGMPHSRGRWHCSHASPVAVELADNARELRQLTIALPLLLILVSFPEVSGRPLPELQAGQLGDENALPELRRRDHRRCDGLALAGGSLFSSYSSLHHLRPVRHYSGVSAMPDARRLRRKVVKMKQETSE